MSGRRSRDKGIRGELEASKELSRLFDIECRRGRQYSGLEGRDVVGLPGVHIEIKRTEKLSLYDAIKQAASEADSGDVPLVLHRRYKKPWLAIVRLDDLPELARRLPTP